MSWTEALLKASAIVIGGLMSILFLVWMAENFPEFSETILGMLAIVGIIGFVAWGMKYASEEDE